MRLFKPHRTQGETISSDNSRGQSPNRHSAYYPQGRRGSQFDGTHEQRLEPLEPPYNPTNTYQTVQHTYPPPQSDTVSTDHAQPPVNIIQPPAPSENRLHSATAQTTDEREGKRSKRSYFGIPSTSKEPTPKQLGRSISVRKRGLPQPSIDTTHPAHRHQHPQSAVEPTQGGQGFSYDRDTVNQVDPSADSREELVQDFNGSRDIRRIQGQLNQSQESIQEGEGLSPGSRRSAATVKESTRASQSPYVVYHQKSSDQNSLRAHETYRGFTSSRHSLGPPSPLASNQFPHIESAQPPSPPNARGQDIMARDGQQPSSRSSTQPPHGHGVDQNQQSQYTSNTHSLRPNGAQSTSGNNDGGRATPPLKSREDISNIDLATLVQKHEELQAKYSKVKRYYFERDTQVQQLQNIVAHQRLSMINTSLDDNEYQNRFNRLDGAINNFAFNIRKDWKSIPPWLQHVVNKDAASVGTKEMTAVGRACITRWLVDEIFERFFHPGLEPGLSSQLKIIEKNIRRNLFHKSTNEEAQKEDHIVKLSNWRLTTVEGLQDMLSSSQSQEYHAQLITNLIEKLTASLEMNLNDPPPPGLEAGLSGIVELAVGIAANIPLESRDVSVEYFMPGAPISDAYMKIEMGLPALTTPGASNDLLPSSNLDQTDRASTTSTGTDPDRDSAFEGEAPPRRESSGGLSRDPREKKKSIFGGLVNKKPTPGDVNVGTSRGSISGIPDRERDTVKDREHLERAAALERERRIRFAAFIAVEITGKGKDGGNILVKAPCYSYAERTPPQRESST